MTRRNMSPSECIQRPSLLPAFEPLSSSPEPFLPAVSTKRKYDERNDDRHFYPTPVPTSSTGMTLSSPGRANTRPCLGRTISSLSERAPLGTVPSLCLNANGDPVHLGRSSNSSDYQLSANRLISRVHVRVTYRVPDVAKTPHGEVLVECLGWNGCKVHVGGRVVELAKEDSFRADDPAAQIIVDVQDTRVQLEWPMTASMGTIPSSPPVLYRSPSKRRALERDVFGSSPPAACNFMRSPSASRSPSAPRSPVRPIRLVDSFAATFREEIPNDNIVRVYEDADVSSKEASRCQTPTPLAIKLEMPLDSTEGTCTMIEAASSIDEVIEQNDENNPKVTGPDSDNMLSGFENLSPTSPSRSHVAAGKAATPEPVAPKVEERAIAEVKRLSPVKNHIINQLAFSRVHSVTLSSIYANLPTELKACWSEGDESAEQLLSETELRAILRGVPCIGEINREGKDAAGKRLEDEYYYLPDFDSSEDRRNTILVSKPPMRNVRKQHKVSRASSIRLGAC